MYNCVANVWGGNWFHVAEHFIDIMEEQVKVPLLCTNTRACLIIWFYLLAFHCGCVNVLPDSEGNSYKPPPAPCDLGEKKHSKWMFPNLYDQMCPSPRKSLQSLSLAFFLCFLFAHDHRALQDVRSSESHIFYMSNSITLLKKLVGTLTPPPVFLQHDTRLSK